MLSLKNRRIYKINPNGLLSAYERWMAYIINETAQRLFNQKDHICPGGHYESKRRDDSFEACV